MTFKVQRESLATAEELKPLHQAQVHRRICSGRRALFAWAYGWTKVLVYNCPMQLVP
jgi:hypothetical protein